jgi:F0F1-type ATP synthase assembly protein I
MVTTSMSKDGQGQDEGPGSSRSGRSTADVAWSIVSTLLAGLLVWGGAGWLVDRWVGTDAVFLPIGLLFGISAAMYLVVVRINRS